MQVTIYLTNFINSLLVKVVLNGHLLFRIQSGAFLIMISEGILRSASFLISWLR